MEYILIMEWEIVYHDEYEIWFALLEKEDKALYLEILAQLKVLAQLGPSLGRPRVDTLKDSKFKNMKEFRIQHKGEPIRIFFAFDPKRQAVLLVGGNKVGNEKRFYTENIPIADKRYQEHLDELGKEENND